MHELLPIAVGIIIGAGWALTGSRTVRAALVVLGACGAVLAFTISGEAESSPAFLLWDLFQVAVAAALAGSLTRRLAGAHRERARRQ